MHSDPSAKHSVRSDIHEWLALNRTPGLGGRRLNDLLDHFGSPAAILAASRNQLRATGIPVASVSYLKAPDWAAVETDLAWLQTEGNSVLTCRDAGWPERLAAIPDPPALLYVHGDSDYLQQPQIAIVGSRNASRDGLIQAHDFARFLGQYGLTVTSGLAIGIDAAAHQGALLAPAGTIAVLGAGLDRIYPAQHRDLAHQIAQNGALVSEFAPGTPPTASNFPRRNRIISGLSLGTLVIEAATRSGSLITARLAMEQGREVFAMPGSIHNPMARGCHALIRAGAKLVETGEHVLEELAGLVQLASTVPPTSPPDTISDSQLTRAPEYRKLLDHMGYEPVAVDQLVARSGLTAEEVSSMLLLLELEDAIHSSAGGRYTRTT
jgi:DNA processing protein